MTVTRNPNKKQVVPDNVIKTIIENGGGIARNNSVSERKNLQLRLESDLIDKIDGMRKKRTIQPSRHTWILEAIYEKLQNEQH